MAVQDEELRLLLSIKGDQALVDLQKKLADVGREEANLKALHGQSAIAEDLLEKETQRLAAAKQRLTAQINGLQAATERLNSGGLRVLTDRAGDAERSLDRIGKASSRSSMLVLNLSRAGQDFAQGGFAGALNNIEGIAAGLPGKLAALAGPATILATIGYVAYQNWDSLMYAVGRRIHVPEPDTSGLDGLKAKLKEVGDEVEKLRKREYIAPEEIDQLKALEKQEKALKKQVEVRDKFEKLKEAQNEADRTTFQAITEAVGEAGGKKFLEQMEADIKKSAVPAVRKNLMGILESITSGKQAGTDALLDYIEATQGKESLLWRTLSEKLVESHKESATDKNMDAVVKKLKEAHDKSVKVAKELTEQGSQVQSEMVAEIAKEAGDATEAIIGDPLKALILQGRDNGVKAKKEAAYLKDAATAEVRRLFPELEKMFPQTFGEVVRGLVVKLRTEVDKTIQNLMAEQNLTKQEATRRLNQQNQDKAQQATRDLARDEFMAFAGKMPGGPRTAAQKRQAAEQMQRQMEEMGVAPGTQVAVGKAFNANPDRANRALGALGDQGANMGQALNLLPDVLKLAETRRISLDAAAARVVDQVIRNEERMANAMNAMGQSRNRQRQALGQIGGAFGVKAPAANPADLLNRPGRDRGRRPTIQVDRTSGDAARGVTVGAQADNPGELRLTQVLKPKPPRPAQPFRPAPQPAPVLNAVNTTQNAVAQTQNATAQNAQQIRRLQAQANQLQRNAQKLQQPNNPSQNMGSP